MTLPPVDLVPPRWRAEPLTHNPFNEATRGIWRVQRGDQSTVLKIVGAPAGHSAVPHWATSDDPGHWNYWQREVVAYREGLAQTAYAPAGIRSPRLLDVVDRPDGSVALWLEYVAGVPGPALTPAGLGAVAHRLGAAHAAWLGRRPALAWLARDWLHDYTTTRPVTEPLAWDHPTVLAAWPDDLRAGLRELCASGRQVVSATRRLPQTLCHHDVWPMNLVCDDGGPVLLDWSFVGPGPLGEDAANLILDTFFDGLVDVAYVDEVVAAVTSGYLRGLAGAVPADVVRRAIRLTGAAKYFWLAPLMVDRLGTAATLSHSYDSRGVTDMFRGRRRPLELLVRWFREVT